MKFLTALTAVCLLTVIPNVTAIDCIQCRVRLENEKIVNGDPTGGCLLQPGWDSDMASLLVTDGGEGMCC